jgi:DNA-binding MarR family transcriptional regulator
MQDELKLPPFHLFHIAGQRADSLFAASALKLTPRQYVVLFLLQQLDKASQSSLVRLTGIDRSTMVDVIRRLQVQGYLQRRRSPADGRAYSVHLTDKGRAALQVAHHAAEQANEQLLRPLPANKRARFLDDLDRVGRGTHLDCGQASSPPASTVRTRA